MSWGSTPQPLPPKLPAPPAFPPGDVGQNPQRVTKQTRPTEQNPGGRGAACVPQAGPQGYSYSKEIRVQSTESIFSSSSFRWLWRETWRCRTPTSVTYFILEKKGSTSLGWFPPDLTRQPEPRLHSCSGTPSRACSPRELFPCKD